MGTSSLVNAADAKTKGQELAGGTPEEDGLSPNAGFFAPAIEATDELMVPSICLLEVFKRVCQQRGEGPALQVVAVMQQGRVVDLDSALALIAAKIGSDTKLALADSVVLATARQAEATLWTQDPNFEGLPGVKFRAKKGAARPTARR